MPGQKGEPLVSSRSLDIVEGKDALNSRGRRVRPAQGAGPAGEALVEAGRGRDRDGGDLNLMLTRPGGGPKPLVSFG